MNAPAPKQEEPLPANLMFHGTGFLVSEIILSTNDLVAKVRDLKNGNEAASGVQQKLVAEDISKIAGQIKTMADTISRVTIAHLNRKPRP